VIAGVEQKARFLAMDCPHSDDGFVAAFPGETTEAFQQGHVLAFQYFGAVPTRILYDNTKIAVARILGGEEREKTKAFLELQSHYLFADKFGRPGKGNDKGDVEGLVGYARRNFMVPIPSVNSWAESNTYLAGQCRKRRERRLRGHMETIGERFERDRAAMLPLPAAPYEACEKVSTRVSSLSLVRYRTNDYSVSTQYGDRQVLVKGYVHEVAIARRMPGRWRSPATVAVDATGLEQAAVSSYFIRRVEHFGQKPRTWKHWLKWLAVVDVERQIILAQWARQAPWNDCATLPVLVGQAHQLTPIGCVLADAEFDSERNHTFCRQQLQAQSIIPAKRRSSCRVRWSRLFGKFLLFP
jgi:hypothetical protein